MSSFIFRWSLLLINVVMASTTAVANVDLDSWIDIDDTGDSADPAAEVLARTLATKLKAEGSKVIFLNVSSCTPALGDEKAWCASFRSSLESNMIRDGLRFLPEASAEDIRRKIANEEVYQQNSMQVDVAKAVEMGKQRAFQSFTSVSVTGDGRGNVKLASSSISIREGVVTVSETIALKVRRESVRPWGVWFKGWLYMGTGIAGTAYGLYEADKSSKKSSDYYDKYKAADNADDAKAYRKKVEKQDQTTQICNIGAGLSGAFALYGLYYYMKNKEDELSYRIKTADSSKTSYAPFVSVRPLILNNIFGLAFESNW